MSTKAGRIYAVNEGARILVIAGNCSVPNGVAPFCNGKWMASLTGTALASEGDITLTWDVAA